VRAAVDSSIVQIRSGRPAMLSVDVTNTSEVIDGVTGVVVGGSLNGVISRLALPAALSEPSVT